MLKFIDIVVNARKYYMGRIYDDFEWYITFENSKIVRVSKSNFVLYTIVIYFIKSMSYMSYNRYIVNRR